MLGIDGQEVYAARGGAGADELAGGNQHLLRGKCDVVPRFNGGKYRLQRRHSDHGADHQIGFRQGGQCLDARGTAADAGAIAQRRRGPPGGLFIRQRNVRNAIFGGLRGHPLGMVTRRKTDDEKPPRESIHNTQHVLANGARAAQQNNSFFRFHALYRTRWHPLPQPQRAPGLPRRGKAPVGASTAFRPRSQR